MHFAPRFPSGVLGLSTLLIACSTPLGFHEGASASGASNQQDKNGGGAAGPSAPSEADAWLGTDRDATFEQHVAIIKAIEVVSTTGLTRLGTTWEAELDKVRGLYEAAKTPDDVWHALVGLKNSYHDAHSHVDASELEPQRPMVSVPLQIRVEYEAGTHHYVVVDEGSQLPSGAVVRAVDGKAIEELEQERTVWFGGGSSPEGLREEIARWMTTRIPSLEPTPDPGTKLELRIAQDGQDQETVATLTWTDASATGEECPPYADPCEPNADGDYAEDPSFTGLGYCVYPGPSADTRVVRYKTLEVPDLSDPSERGCLQKTIPRLSYALSAAEAQQDGPHALLRRDQDQLLDHLARNNVRRVLFDVRENTGGDFDPVFFGAFTGGTYAQPLKTFVFGPRFKDDPSAIEQANVFVALMNGAEVQDGAQRIEAQLRANPASDASSLMPFYCQSPSCAPGEASLPSQSNVVFKAAILTGPQCFSACDDFVSIFRDNGIATTIGLPTGAGDSPFSFDVELPLGAHKPASFHLTVGRSFHPGTTTPLEGNPVPVDIPLPPSSQNRGRYLAAALERAQF